MPMNLTGESQRLGRPVGIPQGLLYYRYFPMWRAFFEALGVAVRRLAAHDEGARCKRGTELGENELCLPVKVFFGHVAELDGKVDFIFVPRVVSVEKRELTCPKFLGLPDMTQGAGLCARPCSRPRSTCAEGAPRLRRRRRGGSGREVGGVARAHTPAPSRPALDAHDDWQRELRRGHAAAPARAASPRAARRLRIGVAGHPYNIYDPHISMDILKRLAERGIDVLVPEMVSHDRAAARRRRRAEGAVLDVREGGVRRRAALGRQRAWSTASSTCSRSPAARTASCRCSSRTRVRSAEMQVPLLSLVIDEHSGEAGFVTRLEAFLDMLTRREAVTA